MTDDERPQGEGARNSRQGQGHTIPDWPKWAAIATAAANVAAVMTFWWLTSGQLSLTKESNEASRRAWVLIDHLGEVTLAPETTFRIQIVAKNYGLSPATKIVIETCVLIQPGRPDPKVMDCKSPTGNSVSVAGPGQPLYVFSPTFTLDETTFRAVISGTSSLYVFGRIRYTDAFKQDRRAYFCQYYTQPRLVSDFTQCDRGNEAE